MDLVFTNTRTGHELRIGCGCLVIILVVLFLAVYGVIQLLGI